MVYSQEFEKGKELFQSNCAGCHNMEKQVVGPALENVIELQGRDWASKWISNSTELIQSGDAHANEVYNQFNKMAMPAFSYLQPEELSSILDYMEGYKKDKEAKVALAAPTTPIENSSGIPTHIWVLFILTLVLIVIATVIIIISLRLLNTHIAKIKVTNLQLMKKLDLDSSEINLEVEKIFDKEVSKRVNEKIETLKIEINDKLKSFK
jgi:cytochrome c2